MNVLHVFRHRLDMMKWVESCDWSPGCKINLLSCTVDVPNGNRLIMHCVSHHHIESLIGHEFQLVVYHTTLTEDERNRIRMRVR